MTGRTESADAAPGAVDVEPSAPEQPTPRLSPQLRRIRLAGFGVYIAALVVLVVVSGVPTGRPVLATIIVVGLLLSRLGRGWRAMAQVILDWLPFTAVLLAYDQTRGIADGLGMPLHEKDILDAEKWLFGGTEPTVWLQHKFYDPDAVHWYDALATLVYTSHFLLTPIFAAILWLTSRRAWLGYITRVIALSLAGLATYILFPAAPPWYAARDGLSDPVSRLSARGWLWFDAGNVNKFLESAQADGTNAVAAMPSLHTAFATLAALVIGRRIRSRAKWLLALYPLAMGLTLVYSGEHYVLDVTFGVVYAVLVDQAIGWWERRRAAGADDQSPSSARRRTT